LAVLKKLGKEAKPAIGAILRNADRLGMFKGALERESKGKGKEMAEGVLDAIDTILGTASQTTKRLDPPVYAVPPNARIPAAGQATKRLDPPVYVPSTLVPIPAAGPGED
jgi:hypothetical protein